MSSLSKRQISRLIKDALEIYQPESNYKNIQPTIDMFNLANVDIERLEKEYSEYRESENQFYKHLLPIRILIALVALGGLGYISFFCISIIINLYCLFFDINEDIDIGLGISILYLCISLFVYFSFNLSYKWLDSKKKVGFRKFYKEIEYNELLSYKKASKDYEWWQRRRIRDFWMELTGREFELEIARLLRSKGYKVTVSKQGGDGGIDLMIDDEYGLAAIQCKAHKNKISPSVARDLLGTMKANNIVHGYLITLNGGTKGTVEFCRENNIKLWDINDILE